MFRASSKRPFSVELDFEWLAVRIALSELPAHQREAVEIYADTGSYRAVATQMGWKLPYAKAQVKQALEFLRHRLE